MTNETQAIRGCTPVDGTKRLAAFQETQLRSGPASISNENKVSRWLHENL